LLNQIYQTSLWTKANLVTGGMSVDCPHRERLGYIGDAHTTLETALQNFNSVRVP
jgi:alpha-L-rhamnosidase